MTHLTPQDAAQTLTEPEFVLLDEVDPEAFPRDRGKVDTAELDDLCASIARHGLRMPIEVIETGGPLPWALVSGRRRYEAFRRLGYTRIPALARRIDDRREVLGWIAEENDQHEAITPWDHARFISNAASDDSYDTLQEATDSLYPTVSRQKRLRLHRMATVHARLDGILPDPATFSQQRLLRLAHAIDRGYCEEIKIALADLEPPRTPREVRGVLDRLCDEAEASPKDLRDAPRPGYPRRRVRIRPRLTCRREYLKEGWCLRFTGPEASGAMMEEIMDCVERVFAPKDRERRIIQEIEEKAQGSPRKL
ncbi:ParB/RepB/Spo0J family partition protein [Histidinibacterium aquaticum]|uniref:ParB-like N-terminal domain-containing protein n=1 Tax=Histidinibacterium aquaticum TaxID=2613962 RepID=A0A5J5GE75_9RHOB|nr:ParB N-terminal domain-containing protein [Histidinibacterium aquaticum]KAA9006063.1 hypothetical protein F3S47_16050 [Histidinibacterium aquaticum]